jgi:hypothetical protein
MSKHRALSTPGLRGSDPPVTPRPTTHRAHGTPTTVVTLGRLVIAGLVLAVAFPAIGSAGSGTGHPSRHTAAANAGGPPLSPQRPEDSERPADRASRPSPAEALTSAAQALTSAPALSSPLLDPVLGGAVGVLNTPLLGSVFAGAVGIVGLAPTATAPAGAATQAAAAQPVAAQVAAALPKAAVGPKAAAAPKKAVAPAAAPYVAGPAGYPFGSSSVWRKLLGSAAVASNSSTLVATLTNSVTSLYNGVAAFNVDSYNTTFYSVAASTPRTDVQFTDCQGKGSEPPGLAEQFAQVPIPSNAVPADGTDAELTIYSASSNQLWEFWQASQDSSGWHACWGGRIDHVSSSPGYFSGGFGATATGLPVAGGMVSIADAKAGVINHAMSLEIVNPASGNTSYPAQRSDGGNSSSSAVPEGTRFRLDPSINVNSLNLTPIAKMIAKAAQTYGFIVTDQSGAVAVQAQSAAGASSDPWPSLMAGVPSYQILANFPWSQLQALPTNWGE